MSSNADNPSQHDSAITINRTIKILHFSDGVSEEIEAQTATDLHSQPNAEEVDPTSMAWGPWFSHYAWKSGTKVLNAVDYAGESLANFFGVTSPKYQTEIDEFERVQEEKKKLEEESVGWVPKNGGGDIPLVLNEPTKDVGKVDI